MVRLHQNLPQSKDVESILRTEVFVESANLSCQFVGIVLCTNDALHNKIRNDVSEQVCVCVKALRMTELPNTPDIVSQLQGGNHL